MGVRIGLVGYGAWGQNWARVLGDRLAWIADPKLSAWGQTGLPAQPYPTDDLRQILRESPDTDGVVIATPASTHTDLARIAAEMGVHALVEKPVGMSYAESVELVSLFRYGGLVLMPGHTFTHTAALDRAMALREDLGRVRYARFEWTAPGKLREDASILYNAGPHPVSLLWRVGGGAVKEPQAIMAAASGWGSDQTELMHIWIRFESGLCAHITLSCIEQVKRRRLVVVGNRKAVDIDFIADDVSWHSFEHALGFEQRAGRGRAWEPLARMADLFEGAVASPKAHPRKHGWYDEVAYVGYLLEQTKNVVNNGEGVLGRGPKSVREASLAADAGPLGG